MSEIELDSPHKYETTEFAQEGNCSVVMLHLCKEGVQVLYKSGNGYIEGFCHDKDGIHRYVRLKQEYRDQEALDLTRKLKMREDFADILYAVFDNRDGLSDNERLLLFVRYKGGSFDLIRRYRNGKHSHDIDSRYDIVYADGGE